MKIAKTRTKMMAACAAIVLGAGFVGNASAAPLFTVSPDLLLTGWTTGSPPTQLSLSSFQASFISGSSSTLVTANGTSVINGVTSYNYQSQGWIEFTAFTQPSIAATASGLNAYYGLYATFTQGFSCGSELGVGVTCTPNSITLNVYGDPWNGSASNGDTYNNGTITSAPTVTDNGTPDILLATANTVYSGTAGLNSQGGAFENISTDFALTQAGSQFFTAPIPFFDLAFSEFNNTTQGVTCDPSTCSNLQAVSIIDESGGVDFQQTVPDPATLALVGVGLLGLGVVRRRKARSIS